MSTFKVARHCEHCDKIMDSTTYRRRHPETGCRVCPECTGNKVPEWAPRRVAHDGGGSPVLNHCPFCGSGAIVAGADGTTECAYCDSHFTVRTQPKHSGTPQTSVTDEGQWSPGQDPVPGMEDPLAEEPVEGEVLPDDEEATLEEEVPALEAPPEEETGEVPEQFKTQSGLKVSEEDYQWHLANLIFRDD